jgi:hypothetical protein
MKLTWFIIALFYSGMLFSQTASPDTVRFKIVELDKEPLRGATLYVKNSNPPYGTVSDFNGNAVLTLKNKKNTIELSFLGPYVAFEINQPTDSIFINLENKKVVYYLVNKKIKKKKLKIKGY